MAAQEMLQLVSFELGGELFALPITKIQEIIRLTHIVKIPKSYDFVEGVINLRGKIIPVIDLRKRFSMEQVAYNAQSRIIVVELKTVTVGLQVDAVCEVLRIDRSYFEAAPTFISAVDQKFIQGIVKQGEKMLIVLDVDKLFSQEETQVLMHVK